MMQIQRVAHMLLANIEGIQTRPARAMKAISS